MHCLSDILFIAICTLLANGEDFEDLVEFGHQRFEWLSEVLILPNGIPSHNTFNRALQLMDLKHLSCSPDKNGTALLGSLLGKQLSIAGKKPKGVSPHSKGNLGLYILNAWVCENRLCVCMTVESRR